MLTDEQVKERTDVTVKMANVVGESAATVSEWMTAIWNNFDDGTRSLESYADVLTRLGAATASSADEIAGGLEKFAAVADTVGLSYDYAATALATITATTRQSEDVVGNALKTIFARIQGLSLGETLEDGVNLNKYSQALADVGIQVLDVNGQLRDMDDLLPEIGAKWGTLSKAQQTALAQTVAGVRQYTQFVALFDNWDTFQTNLAITQGAEGDLQNQADIYEESWAAANKRLKASFEDLYDSVIDEDVFIDLTDGAALLVDGVAGVVDALGGMKGLLLLAGTIGSRVFAKDIGLGIDLASNKIKEFKVLFNDIQTYGSFSGIARYARQKEDTRQQALKGEATTTFGKEYLQTLSDLQQLPNVSAGFKDQLSSLEQVTRLQNKIEANAKNLTAAEQEKLQIQLQEVQALSAQKAEAADQLELVNRQIQATARESRYNLAASVNYEIQNEKGYQALNRANKLDKLPTDYYVQLRELGLEKSHSNTAREILRSSLQQMGGKNVFDYNRSKDSLIASEQNMIKLQQQSIQQYTEVVALNRQIEDIVKNTTLGEEDKKKKIRDLVSLKQQEGKINEKVASLLSTNVLQGEKYSLKMRQAEDGSRKVAEALAVGDRALKEAAQNGEKLAQAIIKSDSASLNFSQRISDVEKNLRKATNAVSKFGQRATTVLSSVSSLAMGFNSLKSAWENMGEATFLENALNWSMGLSMTLSALPMAFKGITNTILKFSNAIAIIDSAKGFEKLTYVTDEIRNISYIGSQSAEMFDLLNLSSYQSAFGIQQNNAAIKENIKVLLIEKFNIKEIVAERWKEIIAEEISTKGKIKGTAAILTKALAEKLHIDTTNKSTKALWQNIAALIVQKFLLGDWKIVLAAVAVGLVAFIKYLSDLPTSLEKAQAEFEDASKRFERFSSVAREAQQELNNLQTAWEELTGAAEKIDGLVTGTQEWKQAIIEANQQILDLLEKYPELAQFVSLVNGQWVMDEDGYQQFMEQEQQEVERAQANTFVQLGVKQQKDSELEFQKFIYENSSRPGLEVLSFLEKYIDNGLIKYDIEQQKFVATTEDINVQKDLDTLYSTPQGNFLDDQWVQKYMAAHSDQFLLPTTIALSEDEIAKRNSQLITNDYSYVNAVASKYLVSEDYQENLDDARKTWSNYTKDEFADAYMNAVFPTEDDLSYEWEGNTLVINKGTGEEATEFERVERDVAEETAAQIEARTMNGIDATKYGDIIEKDASMLGDIFGVNAFSDEYAGLIDSSLEGYYATGQFDFSGWNQEQITFAQQNLHNMDLDTATREAIYKGLEEYTQQVRNNNLQASSDWAENREQIEASELQGDLSEAEMDTEAFENYTETILKQNKALGSNKELAEEVAQENIQFSNTQKKVSKILDDYSDALEENQDVLEGNSEGSVDYHNAIQALQEPLEEFFGFKPDTKFIQENLENIKKSAEGDEKALISLRANAAKEIVLQSNIEDESFKQKMLEMVDSMTNLENQDIEIGASLDDSSFIAGLNNMLMTGQMTAEQVNAYLDNIGYHATYTETKKTIDGPSFGYSGWIDLPEFMGGMQKWKAWGGGKQTITVPQIESINYKGVGGGGITSTPSKPSGGGGGSRKPPEKKNDSDKERYHTLNNQLEDVKDHYEDISEATDRAFGKDKLKLMDDEIKALDKVIDKQEEYRDALAADLPKDKAILEAYYNDLFTGGPEMEFDADGNISNFDEIQDHIYKVYNTNADKMSEAEWEIFEKKYEQFWTYLEQYEETYDLLREKENELRDLANERLDLLVEQAQYKVELKLDISEDSLEMLEYELSLLEDDALNLSSKIALLSEQTSTYYGQSQALSAGIEDILGKMQESGTMTEDAANALRDYKSQLIEINENLLEMREAVQEGLVEAFEEWNDQIGEGLDKFDHYSSILDSYANIIDIVGKETLGIENEFLKNLSQQQVNNSINNLAATREAYLSLEAAAAEAREKLAEAQAIDQDSLSESQKESIQKDILFWQEQLDTIEEEANSAAEDMYSTWEEALEAITTQFEQSVERAVEQFNEAVYGMGGLEQLSEDFARQQEMADMYLKDYEQIYELSKLNRDIQNSIDDTDSIAGKQKLKKLMQDINKLQAEGNEMSEYDLEYLQKTYDLRMAEIALEEAQHAKSQVRLQKDSEGNWAYVYTSAGDAVDEAQQKYEDALFAMQDVSSNYIDEMSEQLIATSQEMAEALANLRVEDFASQEEYEKKVAEVQETYAKQMAAQEAELNKAIDNNKVLYDTDWTNYSNATGYKISSTEEFVTSFKDSMLGLLTDSETDQSNFTSVIDAATEGLITGLLESASTFYANLESAMVAAGTSTDKFATEAGQAIAELGKESEAARESVSMLADEFTSGFASMTETVQSWQGSYGTAIEAAIAANEEMAASINEVLEALSISPEDMTVSYNIYASGKHAASDEATAGYDTGGYTGQWGNSGKIAVLHEKELVLNKDDTTNMLAAVALVRTLTQTIDLNAARAGQGLGGLTASVMKDEVHETLEQQVTIHAEFPNVQDHNEVELALQNMINSSTQYANRK